jgi:hypothetical protein
MMSKKIKILVGFFVLLAAVLACANPLGGNIPIGPANVETVVAATFQALTAQASGPVATLPPESESLLPHPIYFLNGEAAGIVQVYRLARDGKTVTQVTFEPANVEGYDVSLLNGSVVYLSNNQLFTVNADGSNRSMIVDGGSADPNTVYVNRISAPLWSKDGQTITYGFGGINVYSVASGQSTLIYKDELKTDNGVTFGVVNIPISYSPNESKLLINIIPLASDGGAIGVFNPSNQSVVQFGANHRICCSLEWAGDSNTLYGGYAAFNPFVAPGLWRVDAASGAVTDLIPAFSNNESTLNFATDPFLAPDGKLYYFYATLPYTQQDEVNRPPLQLVDSAADGVTNRTVISADIFNTLNETLWSPDASFVITVSGPIAEVYQGGITELYYTDGQRESISLLPFAFELKWGP